LEESDEELGFGVTAGGTCRTGQFELAASLCHRWLTGPDAEGNRDWRFAGSDAQGIRDWWLAGTHA
jgi:hypothetical protein